MSSSASPWSRNRFKSLLGPWKDDSSFWESSTNDLFTNCYPGTTWVKEERILEERVVKQSSSHCYDSGFADATNFPAYSNSNFNHLFSIPPPSSTAFDASKKCCFAAAQRILPTAERHNHRPAVYFDQPQVQSQQQRSPDQLKVSTPPPASIIIERAKIVKTASTSTQTDEKAKEIQYTNEQSLTEHGSGTRNNVFTLTEKSPKEATAEEKRGECELSAMHYCGSPQPEVDVGHIQNTAESFRICLNVGYFEPRDLKVTLLEHILTVSGERFDVLSGKPKTMQRCFSRQYFMPDDIKLNSIRAHITNGILEISGKRTTWKQTEIGAVSKLLFIENKGEQQRAPRTQYVRFGDDADDTLQ